VSTLSDGRRRGGGAMSSGDPSGHAPLA